MDGGGVHRTRISRCKVHVGAVGACDGVVSLYRWFATRVSDTHACSILERGDAKAPGTELEPLLK